MMRLGKLALVRVGIGQWYHEEWAHSLSTSNVMRTRWSILFSFFWIGGLFSLTVVSNGYSSMGVDSLRCVN